MVGKVAWSPVSLITTQVYLKEYGKAERTELLKYDIKTIDGKLQDLGFIR